MRAKQGGLVLLCVAVVMLAACPCTAKVYVAEPYLQDSPTPELPRYIYKPYNVPAGWFATFDGYPVTKNSDDLWVYGTYKGSALTPSLYILGSVEPSEVGLSQFAKAAEISSAVSLPRKRLPVAGPQTVTSVDAAAQYLPDWSFDEHFMAVGGWKDRVDRIGILHTPGVPVAWRGSFPRILYAWNGEGWYAMPVLKGQSPAYVLNKNLYTLLKMVRKNAFAWYGADTPILRHHTVKWGYYWMGEISSLPLE